MQRFLDRKPHLMALFSFLAVAICPAVSAGQKLLSLVPPGAGIVAKVSPSSRTANTGDFILVTHNNSVDLNDFYAISGADSTRIIDQVILVAIADSTGRPNEHSLLAHGHFDEARIFRSALDNGAVASHYAGTRILIVQPFAREAESFHSVRWLAALDSEILLFGTPASIQQEIDRFVAHSEVDPFLLYKLVRMHRDDATRTLLSLPTWTTEIRNALTVINPQLAAGLKDGDAFQFGIRYGRHVEFEYEITTASTTTARAISDSLTHALAGPEEGSAFLPSAEGSGNNNRVRGVVKVSIARYNAWLEKISAQGRRVNAASPR